MDAVLEGNRLALARLLTQVENKLPEGRTALAGLFPHTGRAHLIGVTGAGLDDVGVHSLGEVATEMGVTPERIRQIERKSLRKLRWHARRCFPENMIRYHALVTNRNGTLAPTSTKTPRVKRQQRRRPLDHMNGYRGGNPGYGQPSGASMPPYAATTSVKQYEIGNSQPGPIASREDFDWRLFSHELIPSLAGIFLLSIAITGRGTVLLSMLMGAPLVIPVKITAFLMAMASTPWILKAINTAYDWRTYRHQWRDNCDVIAKYSYLAWGFALITGLCASLWLQTIGSEGAQLFTVIFGNGSGLQIRAFVYAGTMLANTKLSLAITPYFFNLIDPANERCPIRLQVIPRAGFVLQGWNTLAKPLGFLTR